jgi:hypothetical protein
MPSLYSDGFGERDVLRADVTQRLEYPVRLGVAGLRWTPFAELHGTAWSEGELEADSPTRAAALAGMRLSTSFWKSLSGNGLAQFSPRLEVRGDLASEESDGKPVAFDAVETPLDGRFVEAGFYTRWDLKSIDTTFDADLRQAHASDVAPGAEEGWLPAGVFAGLSTTLYGIPIGVLLDARYDFSPRQTVYSTTSVGTGVKDKWGIEASHRYGRDLDREPLYEAASLAARYRWTPKWEWEARQTFSLSNGSPLSTKGILRRYAHDMIFQLELSTRSGEGGSTFNFSFRPRVNWDPSDIGLLDPWND